MKLQPGWRFGAPGAIEVQAVHRFSEMVSLIASQGDRRAIFELYKKHFAGPAGRQYAYSSSESWAEGDLNDYMRGAAGNAPLFIEAFVDGSKALAEGGFDVPDEMAINRILIDCSVGYRVHGEQLVAVDDSGHLPTPTVGPISLNEEGKRLVLDSFSISSRLFEEGRHRQAVQELLWLLETVSTAFRGLGDGDQTIKGRYFNDIAKSLRQMQRGTFLEQTLNWMTTLHGYLSAPAGGGIRHGWDLNEGVEMTTNDAILVANLIRSYIMYLMAEHQRMTGRET